ncbi:Lysine-specific demethylase se14 [Thalictrum thalictroides]|uniref:Lysine-specific demethylase se14 n=1 Tax=Thalictrum thalictroides TaxID=46969 RepID=A0A7J6W578_THATH|nr:Lysine-specific demethylase se14 [Thalictrum thalictroides]
MGNVETPNWLKELPLAPTYYPTDTEFADPIAYISKIEKEASVFGICKVVPPLPKPSKKYVWNNLNNSLMKFTELGNGEDVYKSGGRAVFTTRHQELGCSMKKTKGQQSVDHKQVWQSGEVYTLEQFESKAKLFARNHLGMIKEVTPLVVEALFWKAASEKPIYIEYANDVPGSGFGEPEELCRYFHRRRRRRGHFNQNHQEITNTEKHKADSPRNSFIDGKDAFVKNDSYTRRGSSRQTLNSSASVSEESLGFVRTKSSNVGKDGEGTAGWILSNSPWNLQVIARSPGSLTRFMLDDIPGVTSPMIYIGMLFSWFAWHVEDHELHSLNFLHTGSSKTWYAVPGEYAFSFEEVIRSKGYGGDLDRLAALTRLGEKTNLLSPEAVIASGIPCCRLVQNPGEFVVTFPRAYHIGFSHGFNCGEAANFGTPQWLKVAKAAAVRRAAMNYLPMLSHQQLLYMLTMSFLSRVPRALVMGMRTSRLKDRQKEERELLVKKAFIDDMLNENNLLSVLFKKESTLNAVLWDPEALPSPEAVPDETSIFSALSIGKTSAGYHNDDSCYNQADSTGLSMEKLEDFYVDNDDLPCGLHVDSGTLACVACGVLGYPFMAIVQPSQRASEELFPVDCQVFQGQKVLRSRSMKSNAPSDLYDVVIKSVSDVHELKENLKVSSTCRGNVRLPEDSLWKCYIDPITTPSESTKTVESKETTYTGQLSDLTSNSYMKWTTSNGFLRPRVFCLEHALEIDELLHSRGGANLLIICHSAYPKIKAHALAVAEEIGTPFDCDEIPLQFASKEDLDLLNISIDNEEHEQCEEDWTSRLGLNLRYCVKLSKLFPSKPEHHALALGGLFSDAFSGLDYLSLKWKSRRARTPSKITGPMRSKSCGSTQTEKRDVLVKEPERSQAAGEIKYKQYSRRRYNHKAISPLKISIDHYGFSKKPELKYDFNNNLIVDNKIQKDNLTSVEKNGNDFMELNNSSILNSGKKYKDCVSDETRGMSAISGSSRFTGLISTESTEKDISTLTNLSAVNDSVMLHNSCIIGEAKLLSEVSDPLKCASVIENDTQMLDGLSLVGIRNVCITEDTSEVSDNAKSVHSPVIPSSGVGVLEASSKDQKGDKKEIRDCNLVVSGSSRMQHKISNPMKLSSSQPTVISLNGSFGAHTETRILLQDEEENKACSNVMVNLSEMHIKNQTTSQSTHEAKVCDFSNTMAQPSLSSSMVESSEVQEFQLVGESNHGGETSSTAQNTMEQEDTYSIMIDPQSTKRERKRGRELELLSEDKNNYNSFIKSPCEGLRPRTSRILTSGTVSEEDAKVETARKKAKRPPNGLVTSKENKVKNDRLHRCDIEGCQLSFKTRDQLIMHKRNRCTHNGCGKQFRSHRYAVLHQRVHVDERPLKCPWKGCTMSFKWAWAKTEHLRLHTGERPYKCKMEGCGLTFSGAVEGKPLQDLQKGTKALFDKPDLLRANDNSGYYRLICFLKVSSGVQVKAREIESKV